MEQILGMQDIPAWSFGWYITSHINISTKYQADKLLSQQLIPRPGMGRKILSCLKKHLSNILTGRRAADV